MIADAIRGALASAGIVTQPKIQDFDSQIRELEMKNELPQILPEFQQNISFQVELPTQIKEPNSETLPSPPPQNNFPEPASANFEIPLSSEDFERKAENKVEEEGKVVLEFKLPTSAVERLTEEKRAVKIPDVPAQNLQPVIRNYDVIPPVDSAANIPKAIEPENIQSSKIRPIGQLHESFIIATDDEGLLLIDQHVAHERILFDKFRRKETERKIESQNLLLPETFDLTPAQAVAFNLVEEELENLGFGLMRLSGRTVAVKSVPTDLPPSEIRNLLAEVLDTVEKEKSGNAKQFLRDHIAASLACKAAVKINMKLTPEKMQWLIDRLLITSSPTTCPHGRPVILRLTMRDIERGFHRT